MSQSEINEVVGAVEALVRRAYMLGRRDGLRHLVQVAQADEAIAKPLALLAPAAEAQVMQDPFPPANDSRPSVIVTEPPKQTSRYGVDESAQASQGSLTDFLIDFFYPAKAS
ncbi:MAG: hypothetical protein JSR21_06970 [Proteobacteria bacterium]|nr:hypothetical protein [Pseudomonadota bacterium]